MELITTIILFIGGFFTGIYGSNVGGGALVTLPLLILSGLPTHVAIASNRLNAVMLEFSGSLRFYIKKQLNLKLGIIFGIIAAVGSFIGSTIVIKIDEKYLNIIVAVLLLSLFLILTNKKNLGIKEKRINKKNMLIVSFFIFLLGIYGGFFGGGFGTFSMFALVMLGFTFIKSAAIARLIGFIMSVSAALVFAFNGLINYPYAISLGLGSAIGAWVGVSIGIKKGNKFVKVLFVAVILVTIVKLVLGVFGVI